MKKLTTSILVLGGVVFSLVYGLNALTFSEGQTVLMLMAKKGNYIAVKALIILGADVNRKDKNGRTAIFYAINDCGETLTLLTKAGANIKEKDIDGCTVLHYSVLRSQNQFSDDCLVKTLLELGIEVDVQDNEGSTPLMYALDAAPVSTVETLLEKGADVNIQNNDGYTPLMWVAGKCVHPDQYLTKCAHVLLIKGANPNLLRKNGRTALMDAASENHFDLVKLLVDWGAQVDLTDQNGWTAILAATKPRDYGALQETNSPNQKIVTLLKAASVEKTSQNNTPKTLP